MENKTDVVIVLKKQIVHIDCMSYFTKSKK